MNDRITAARPDWLAPSRRTVCVLGGTGFVGRRLLAHLARRGHALRVPVRRPVAPGELRVLPNLQILHGDVLDPAFLDTCVRGCDTVVNLVGILNEKGRDGSGFRTVHVDLVRALLASAMRHHVRKLIQISALRAGSDAPSHYLRSKGEAEELIRQSASMAWTILQPSVIFGPDDSFLNRFADLLRFSPVLPLVRADARFAPVHVDDLVAAIERALNNRRTDGRVFQLCGAETCSLRSVVHLVAQASGVRRWVFGLPDWLGLLQARALELVPGKPLSVDNFRSLGVPSLCTQDGFAELGLRPRSMRGYLTHGPAASAASRA